MTRLSLLYPTGELAATTSLQCFGAATGYEEFTHELFADAEEEARHLMRLADADCPGAITRRQRALWRHRQEARASMVSGSREV